MFTFLEKHTLFSNKPHPLLFFKWHTFCHVKDILFVNYIKQQIHRNLFSISNRLFFKLMGTAAIENNKIKALVVIEILVKTFKLSLLSVIE